MAYIGIDPNVGDISFQTFTGNGSATAFTLGTKRCQRRGINCNNGNVIQEPGIGKAYTAFGTTLTFSSPPANGDVIHRALLWSCRRPAYQFCNGVV